MFDTLGIFIAEPLRGYFTNNSLRRRPLAVILNARNESPLQPGYASQVIQITAFKPLKYVVL